MAESAGIKLGKISLRMFSFVIEGSHTGYSAELGRVGGKRELHRLTNLRLEGFSFPTRGRCPEVERVAAEVLTEVLKTQDVVAVMREPQRGYDLPALQSGSGS